MFSDFLTTSILISFLGILLVFLLVLLLSKIAMKPICESYAKQKRFITDASHEIKTPLSIISANTEVIEMENGESKWTNSTNQQIKRLTNLTNQLISLSRMEEENTQISKTDFSLSNAILETTEPFSAIAQTKNKKFEIAVSPNISYYGDEKSLRQLFSILLDNAFKYSDENGNIKVSLKKSGVKKEIIFFNTVEDISVGSHNDFFDRFYRNDTSRNSKTGGYGIGLSLAKSIVELHKGKIKAFSVDGKSFAISILL
ncbi:MAG: HAMP domain-containing sensor histidine kinase [Oscillospiraceae bacterium]